MLVTSWHEKRADGSIACTLCPNLCVIAKGRTGICRVRRNEGGELALPFFGAVSSISMDPIEKKPLHHFFPGSTILSVGFLGCNLHCPFCQNHSISQTTEAPARRLDPEDLVALALKESSFGIAYTYSEPTIHFEYVLETAKLAHAKGLKNVLVSNGYLNPGPTAELLPLIDAANIDLKSFEPEFYSGELGGQLEAVKDFIRECARTSELEVTTLVIPGKNDSEREIAGAADFLASISPDIPYHLSCYFPSYRYSIPATNPETVERLAAVARARLRYVYTGNVHQGTSDTLCPACGNLLIRRRGYETSILGLSGPSCSRCGTPIPITRS